jgi:hypothetical protein
MILPLFRQDSIWTVIGRGYAVVAVAGALRVFLNVREIRSYD